MGAHRLIVPLGEAGGSHVSCPVLGAGQAMIMSSCEGIEVLANAHLAAVTVGAGVMHSCM